MVAILGVGRSIYPVLAKLITWPTVGLLAAWAVLAVLDGSIGRPELLDEATLAIGYVALAALIVNAVAVVFYVGKRLGEPNAKLPTIYARIVRIASIAGIAVAMYIVSTHRS